MAKRIKYTTTLGAIKTIYYKNFDLTNYNSFHLYSIAKEIWFPKTLQELHDLLILLKNSSFKILSEGTNVLLAPKIDKIICLKSMPKNILWNKRIYKVSVSANYNTNNFIKEVIKKDCRGMEGLLGIPGSLGGAIVGNSGSGKYTISDYLDRVLTITYDGKIKVFLKKELKFKRRYSILQNKKLIVYGASFVFNNKGANETVIGETIDYRRNFPKGYSAGGIFKNWWALKPYEELIRAIKSPNLVITKHLNIIINNGFATYKEILNFINQIKNIVKEPLYLEVKILK